MLTRSDAEKILAKAREQFDATRERKSNEFLEL